MLMVNSHLVMFKGDFRYRAEQHKGVNGELTKVMIREIHVEVGGGPAHEGLGLQGGVDQGLVDERMNQDVAGYLIL